MCPVTLAGGVLTELGSLPAGMRDLNRQIRQLNDQAFDYCALFEWLQRYLESSSKHQRDEEDVDASVLPFFALPNVAALPDWSGVSLPRGSCTLSEQFDWPFDLRQSEEAVDWVLRRLIEGETLRCLPPKAAAATFPPASGNTNTVFGPFNEIGLVMNLKSCPDLKPELARLSVPTRERWHQYLNRQEPLELTRFPPLTHAVGVMVGHREFTDEVAMDVYGIFKCGIEVTIANGLLPAFGSTSAADCSDVTLSNGSIMLRSLNGATVLCIACILLRAESSVHKLLDMEVTGMVVLQDMAENGLGWMMRARDARAIVAHWLKCTEYYFGEPPPVPKLSLLLKAWITREGGGSAFSQSTTPLLLYREAEILLPSEDDHKSLSPESLSPNEREGASAVRSGIFHGSACGVVRALHMSGIPPFKGDDISDQVEGRVANLVNGVEEQCNSALMSKAARNDLRRYLVEALHNAETKTLDELDQLHHEALRKLGVDTQVSDLTRHSFYRAFLVALTDGRLQDDGEGPLEWSDSLHAETDRKRRALLGIPSDEANFRTTSAASRGSAFTPSSVFRLVIVCAISLGAAVILSRNFIRSTQAAPASLPPDILNATEGIGRILQGVDAGPDLHLRAGERVYILTGDSESSYRVATKAGDVGVSLAITVSANISWS